MAGFGLFAAVPRVTRAAHRTIPLVAFVRSSRGLMDGSGTKTFAGLGGAGTLGGFETNPSGRRPHSWLLAEGGNDGANTDENDIEPSWTYVPYDAKKAMAKSTQRGGQRRSFSTWTVPEQIDIPEDKLDIQFVRSSGAGGQNVNKVNTKVELRFEVRTADWMPGEVRDRFQEQQANRINKDGFFSLQSQESRTQGQNRKAAVAKLKEMVRQAWPRPKVRKQRKGISKAAKERNKEVKRKRSETKQNRKNVDW